MVHFANRSKQSIFGSCCLSKYFLYWHWYLHVLSCASVFVFFILFLFFFVFVFEFPCLLTHLAFADSPPGVQHSPVLSSSPSSNLIYSTWKKLKSWGKNIASNIQSTSSYPPGLLIQWSLSLISAAEEHDNSTIILLEKWSELAKKNRIKIYSQ